MPDKLPITTALKKISTNQRVFALLALIIIACDYKILGFGFLIGWDDHWVVLNSYTEQGFSRQNLLAILLDFYRGQYAPVNQLYYTALHEIFGYDAFWFHAAGLTLHILNCYLVYLLVSGILCLERINMEKPLQVSILTAVLFAVHPLNLEASAWISASKIPLYTFFYLLGLLSYIKFLKKRQWVHYIALLGLFLFSFGAKEQAVVLPLCLLLFDHISGRSFNKALIWIEKLPFFLLSAWFGLITIASQQLPQAAAFHYSFHFTERILLACYSLSEYFTKCLVPVNVSFLYPFPFEPGAAVPGWLYVYPFLLIICMIWIWSLRRQVWLIFSTLFFMIHIVIALNLLSTARYAVIADRYIYVSSIGAFFLIACLFTRIAGLSSRTVHFWTAMGVFIAILAIYTNVHSEVWRDSMTLRQQIRKDITQRKDYKQMSNEMGNEDKR
jgi:hypothetical protein